MITLNRKLLDFFGSRKPNCVKINLKSSAGRLVFYGGTRDLLFQPGGFWKSLENIFEDSSRI